MRPAAGGSSAFQPLRVDVDGQHLDAFGKQALRHGLADAARRAGHDRPTFAVSRAHRPHQCARQIGRDAQNQNLVACLCEFPIDAATKSRQPPNPNGGDRPELY